MARNYRIRFIAEFSQTITADDDAQARQITDDLIMAEKLLQTAHTDNQARCRWNIIELIKTDD